MNKLINKPISLSKKDLPKIYKDYAVGIKYDGERALIVITEEEQPQAMFSKKVEPISGISKMKKTIIDCEYYKDKYYCFDLLFYNGENIENKPYKYRYTLLKKLLKKFKNLDLKEVLFKWNKKQLYNYYKNTEIDNDGLIFTPNKGYREIVYKWKPENELTIDVKVMNDVMYIKTNDYFNRTYGINSKEKLIELSRLLKGINYNLLDKGLSDGIYEVYYTGDGFKVKRTRPDKIDPNFIHTARSILELILDPVRDEDLFGKVIGGEILKFEEEREIEIRFGHYTDEGNFVSNIGKERYEKLLENLTFPKTDIKINYTRIQDSNRARVIMDKDYNIISYDIKKQQKKFDFPEKGIRVAVSREELTDKETFTETIDTNKKFMEIYRVKMRNIMYWNNWEIELSKVYTLNKKEEVDELLKREPSSYELEVELIGETKNVNTDIEHIYKMLAETVGGSFYKGEIKKKKYFKGMAKFHNYIKEELLRKYASNVSRLLDIGSGVGGDIHKWMNVGVKEVVGIEPSKESIKIAKGRLEEIKPDINIIFKQGRGDKPINDSNFDVVVCNFSFHYFYTKIGIDNIIKSLKKGGIAIITVFDSDKIKEKTIIENGNKLFELKKVGDNKISVRFEEFRGLDKAPIETLIPSSEFIKKMKERGMSLIEKKTFDKYYEDRFNLQEEVKEVSFMYCSYVFKKN